MASGATSQAAGIVNFASGSFTSAGVAEVVTIGFKARWIRVVNSTDTITWEKMEGLAAANTIKEVADTLSVDTSSMIVIGTDGTFTIHATAAGTSKALAWVALG